MATALARPEMTPATSWVAGGAAAVLLIMGGSLFWLFVDSEPATLKSNSPRLVAAGKIIYARHCASCHGADLEGQPNWRQRQPNGRLPAPPHDASGHTWHHSDTQLFEMVKNGMAAIVPGYETDMPAFDGVLSDDEIWAVLSFIESTWPPSIRERQQRLDRRLR